MNAPDKPWKVLVDDNFHYGETSHTPVASFDTLEEAIAECRSRVDDWLRVELKPGMDAATLYEHYTIYGEDPWILGGKLNDPVPFCAWDYAKERCKELCREDRREG
jgi:hypothetical protein